MTNPALLLPPKARAAVYATLALLAIAVGATQEAYDALEAAYPAWLLVADRVVPYLTAALGGIALSHVDRREEAVAEETEALDTAG